MVFHSIAAGQIDSVDITQARCLVWSFVAFG